MLSERDVARIDNQKRSVFLRDGRQYGFAQARRMGLDVEAVAARFGPGSYVIVPQEETADA